MNDPEKSDRPIVSEKQTNKAGLGCHAAETVEKRGLGKGSQNQQNQLPDTEPGKAAT